MSEEHSVPVLIVGAGPAGLTLACDLARRGVRLRVIDKADWLFIGSRGKGLQPRTLEVFDDLGVIDAIVASGAPFPGFRCYANDQVAWDRSLAQMLGIREPVPTPDIPYPSAWIIPQWRTDEILAARLEQLGGRVELSTELVAFTQDADGVSATVARGGVPEQIRCDYLIGTDGGRSFVRKALGVGFAGETFETERTIIGDVRVDGPLDHDHCHLLTRAGSTGSADRFSLWGLPVTDYFQLVVNVTADAVPDLTLEGMQVELERRSGRTDIRLHDLRWISLYRVNVRMADRFRVGRVFLAGDAAHVHSSAGGQGLNTSVQDAYNLGWKLGAVLSGAPADLLDTYEAERMPIAADLLGLTTRWHRQDFKGPPADTEPSPGHKLSQLSLNYRGGPLAWDDRAEPGSVRAGDRAPDAPCHDAAGNPTRLFDIFRGPHFTLLSFGEGPHPAEVTNRFPVIRVGRAGDLIDNEGHIHHGFGLDPITVGQQLVLIRPDGYIGLMTDGPGSAEERLGNYLKLVTPARTG
ncbi:FAD-dependent monooxygenase [Singulisphaera acidiphila]|uniref:2-polyprenyl-6-methoxyphenol hydroxylase-like oxidoreductase n=1 Tax=Singulisphaera acidiphila (strain ATCC BAA-1392 / DSM 18658 / VKM B-2454 / MOB10) TaxID=886293 RepID=L0DPD9_SINAD|nr:FAD-dependent monooxygenase [Singulisphaera acidiphila]AGA31239.1 2-polyprenyl-6-methoxyphenol hydroxylase-like oxidoreductase [Singulisphaera acidiphila DSM 18658]